MQLQYGFNVGIAANRGDAACIAAYVHDGIAAQIHEVGIAANLTMYVHASAHVGIAAKIIDVMTALPHKFMRSALPQILQCMFMLLHMSALPQK